MEEKKANVYSDIVSNGWILPKKEKYTMKDFREVHKKHDAITSRFIIICSAIYHYYPLAYGHYSQIFDNIEHFLYMPD